MADISEDDVSSHKSSDNEPLSSNDSSEETIVEEPKFGLWELISTLMDLKTLPHIILLSLIHI